MAKKRLPKNLNERQRSFCLHYLKNGWNAKQAAISAGYSELNAESIGCRLSRNIKVASYIAQFQEDIEKTVGLSKAMILSEQKRIVFDKRTNSKERQAAIRSIVDILGYASPTKVKVETEIEGFDVTIRRE